MIQALRLNREAKLWEAETPRRERGRLPNIVTVARSVASDFPPFDGDDVVGWWWPMETEFSCEWRMTSIVSHESPSHGSCDRGWSWSWIMESYDLGLVGLLQTL